MRRLTVIFRWLILLTLSTCVIGCIPDRGTNDDTPNNNGESADAGTDASEDAAGDARESVQGSALVITNADSETVVLTVNWEAFDEVGDTIIEGQVTQLEVTDRHVIDLPDAPGYRIWGNITQSKANLELRDEERTLFMSQVQRVSADANGTEFSFRVGTAPEGN